MDQKKRLDKIINSKEVQNNQNFTLEQVEELFEIFTCFEDKYNQTLNFRDLISAVKTLGLLDKNPIIMKILLAIEQEVGDDEMTFEYFLEQLTGRLGHPSTEDGRETLFHLIDQDDKDAITFDDLQVLAAQIGYTVSDQEIKDIIEAITSKQGDTEITLNDFQRHMSRRYK